MNVKRIIEEIKKEYPGKRIILDPPDNPTEIICELDPTSNHTGKSIALAVVGSSKPHFHKKTTEVYKVVRGSLIIFKDGIKNVLNEGEKITIEPNIVHHAEGDEAWFLTYSKPGWTFEDHIHINTEKSL
jgi:quercetin dioxygenase-like cupin family protein